MKIESWRIDKMKLLRNRFGPVISELLNMVRLSWDIDLYKQIFSILHFYNSSNKKTVFLFVQRKSK